jgi:hypothetical protein
MLLKPAIPGALKVTPITGKVVILAATSWVNPPPKEWPVIEQEKKCISGPFRTLNVSTKILGG